MPRRRHQLSALTPNMLIHGTKISLPDEIMDDDPGFNNATPPTMLKNLNRCKDVLRKRSSDEFLQSLREKHKCFNGTKPIHKVGDIMQIKGDKKNCGELEIGIITQLIKTKDTVVRTKIKMGNNSLLERPNQFPIMKRTKTSIKEKSKRQSKTRMITNRWTRKRPRTARIMKRVSNREVSKKNDFIYSKAYE